MSNTKSNELKDRLRAMMSSYKSEQCGNTTLFNADCFNILKELPDNCICSAVIDGPYGWKDRQDNFKPNAIRKGSNRKGGAGISPSMFSGSYDYSRNGLIKFQQFSYKYAVELLRVLKPGSILLSCISSRMYHRMATGIEDAGFETLGQLNWLCGQAHSYSPSIGKMIDKRAGIEQPIVGPNPNRKGRKRNWNTRPKNITLPVTDKAKQWHGWHTRIRYTNEPILIARKTISERTLNENVERHGTGAFNTEKCKYGDPPRYPSNTLINEAVAEVLGDKAPFFYTARPSNREKNAGCEHLVKRKGNHSTIKPISLMEYLVKLVTPPHGTCIDIFMGAGSTAIACSNLGFDFIGIEIVPEYYEIAKARISHWQTINKAA